MHGSSFFHQEGRHGRRRRRGGNRRARRAGHRAVQPKGDLAPRLVVSQAARHDLWRRRDAGEICVGSDRRQFHHRRLRRRRDRSGAAGRRCGLARAPSRPATRSATISGARTRLGALRRRAVLAQRPRHERLVLSRRRHRPHPTSSSRTTRHRRLPVRQHRRRRWAAGSARRSTPSPICRASRCASAALPARS